MESELPSTLSPILIGQELLARGHVAQPDLDRALAYQAQSPNDRLGAILVRLGALSEENLLSALSAQTGYPVVALADVPRSGVAAALKALRRRRPYGCRSRPGCL
jgi:general secretion pathway protein E